MASARGPKPARARFSSLRADHGRVSARTRSPGLSPTSCSSLSFLPFLPLVSLATEPHLREPLASAPRACYDCCCCCLLVCRGASIPVGPSFRLWFAPSRSPRAVFVVHAPCFVCFCLCLERRRTIKRRRLIDGNPAISPERCLRGLFSLLDSLKCCKYPHVLTVTGFNH